MGCNNATVVVVLRDLDNSGEVYYVNQTHNPDSVIGNKKDFTALILSSDVYEGRKNAMSRAKEYETYNETEHGILVYDSLDRYTLDEALFLKRNQYT